MSLRRAFIVMPFGLKKAADGGVIDFDPIYRQYLKPAVEQAGLSPHRADADKFGGSIHADMPFPGEMRMAHYPRMLLKMRRRRPGRDAATWRGFQGIATLNCPRLRPAELLPCVSFTIPPSNRTV